MKARHTTCALRLGDNIAHLHFLRKMAQAYPKELFIHGCHLKYLQQGAQLQEVIEDLHNVRLISINESPPEALNAWKNTDGFWERHPWKNDYAAFYIDWFWNLAAKMGLDSPINTVRDLLFDYPGLIQGIGADPFDILFINARPMSNQWQGYDAEKLNALGVDLAKKHRVISVNPITEDIPNTIAMNLSVTGIGQLSLLCKHIVMVSTGPSWPTFNVWGTETVKSRLILIDHERIELCPNTAHAKTIDEARDTLTTQGLL